MRTGEFANLAGRVGALGRPVPKGQREAVRCGLDPGVPEELGDTLVADRPAVRRREDQAGHLRDRRSILLGPISTKGIEEVLRECLARPAADERDDTTAPSRVTPLFQDFVEGSGSRPVSSAISPRLGAPRRIFPICCEDRPSPLPAPAIGE